MKSARDLNSENLSYVNAARQLKAKNEDYWRDLSSGENLYYVGYNVKRGTSSFSTPSNGKAERFYLNTLMKEKGSPTPNVKPLKSMNGFSF